MVTLREGVRWAQTFVPGWAQEAWWDSRQAWYRRHGPHETEFRGLPMLGLRSGARVLDLGANRGQSIDACRQVLGECEIVAVEPSARLAGRLIERYPDVKVVQAGVGSHPDRVMLYTPSYRGFRYDGLASCNQMDASNWFAYSIWRYKPSRITIEAEEVEIVTVDSLGVEADFVKMDVQGMELATLAGMTEMLTRQRPILMIETPDSRIVSHLADFGYTPRWWHRTYVTASKPMGWPLNVFFVPSKLGR
jgi:FkbM family methyltransferase